MDAEPRSGVRKKKLVIAAALEHAKRCPGRVVTLFQDEASFYRQPSQGCLWSWAGRKQPRLPWSHRSNTLVRASACLDALTGATHVLQAKRIDIPRLLQFYRQVLTAYPEALMIYMVEDNWPVHKHPTVQAFLASQPRLQVLYLPTYAPRLNPIEKLWRWTRQVLCHAHPFCDDFNQFKAQLRDRFDEAAAAPEAMAKYCGLLNLKIYT